MIEFHQRLRDARIAAGFDSAQDAVARFGWTYATYAGHENGSRGAKAQAVSAYAKAFKTTEQWLSYGTGKQHILRLLPNETSYAFNEPQIVPFSGAKSAEAVAMRDALVKISQPVNHPTVYKTNAAFPSIAISKGDVLLVELNGIAEDGDIAVCTKADSQSGNAQTTLMRLAGHVMIGEIGDDPIQLDDPDIGILGHVASIFRSKR